MLRTGLILKKIATTRLFDEKGISIPATILQLQDLEVIDNRTLDRDGYLAVCLGAGTKKTKRSNAPMNGYLKKQGIANPKALLCEFRVSEDCLLPVKAEINVSHFVTGQYVDVVGKSIGKGFAGGMKRHNFSGLRASHGVSVSHRSMGSTGHCQDPGRVFKGKKMPGHMGAERTTKLNLKVLRVDAENNFILVHGSVPGAKNSWVLVRDAAKKPLHEDLLKKAQPVKESKE